MATTITSTPVLTESNSRHFVKATDNAHKISQEEQERQQKAYEWFMAASHNGMKTALIEIKSDYAGNILDNLEKMNAIRVYTPDVPNPETKQKLSERFAGCLSKTRVETLQKELTEMRNEWDRNF
jgi:vacuolar-type H+-ATPase subunit D/Vma8